MQDVLEGEFTLVDLDGNVLFLIRCIRAFSDGMHVCFEKHPTLSIMTD